MDTIVAISTALGIGAISIIRVSGENSIEIVDKIFKGKNLTKVKSHTLNYGHIVYKNEVIDEVLIGVMHKPKTFTKENIVEINCHGGIATTNKILEILLLEGCRQAEPGEFTKRAFLNGRIDLTEAEAVMDLISAETDTARKMSINTLMGKMSNEIKNLRQKILEILANIEVNIDYPEYEDIEEVTVETLPFKLKEIKESLNNIYVNSKTGNIIKNGIKTVIIGKPNVGKSSLLNSLIKEDKAIVTDIAGTTRDIVEGVINLDGILINLIDTAGIRETKNKVEEIGVLKSLNLIDEAELILYVLDNNEYLSANEIELLNKIKNKNYIIIINKIDLEKKLQIIDENIVEISTKNNIGIDKLKEKIKQLFNLEKIETKNLNYLTNVRSISIIEKCVELLEKIEMSIERKDLIDMIEIDIKEIWSLLGQIIGETYDDELIDQLFSQFCLGK